MRIALNFYTFQGGAPRETAQYTAAGAQELERRIDRETARRLGLSLHAERAPAGRDDRLSPEGIKNFANVRTAVAQHFEETVRAILRGEKPVGIGGDHSMAAGTLRGTVLGVAVREILEGTSLPLRGPKAEQYREAFTQARANEDVAALGRLLDDALDEGALSLHRFRRFKARFEVIWVDAHYDFNTPATSPSGNFHGMVGAAAAGRGPPAITEYASKNLSLEPTNFGFVAVRDPDTAEMSLLERLGVVSFDMEDVRAIGVKAAIRALVRNAETRSRKRSGEPPFLLFQIDIDALDAPHVPRTGTPVGTDSPRNPAIGPSLAQLTAAVRNLISDPRVESIDIAELAYCSDDPTHPTLESGERVLGSLLGLRAREQRALFRPGAQEGAF